MTIINEGILQAWAKEMIKKWWNRDDIPSIIISDKRWNRRFAVYWSGSKTIEFSKGRISQQIEEYGVKHFKETLLHELCHWHLHTTGQPYRDSTTRFAKEIIRVGSHPSGTKTAQDTFKQAEKELEDTVFIIKTQNGYSDNLFDEVAIRHNRKNKDDFEKDLRNTLIRMKNIQVKDFRNGAMDYLCEDTVYDVAEMMIRWYGYSHEKRIVASEIVLSSECGDVTSQSKGEWGTDDSPLEENLTALKLNDTSVKRYMKKWDVANESNVADSE